MPTARPNPIHTDRTVQHVDVRIYFPQDVPVEDILNRLNLTLSESRELPDMISAYQLVNDGFAHLTPTDKPLA